ncbi:MAG: transglutaminase domain-containing protein [Candidatus Bipolaricaulota bacterium]
MRRKGLASLIVMAISCLAMGASSSWLYVLEGTFRQEIDYVYRVMLEPDWSVSATVPQLRETTQPWYAVDVLGETIGSTLAPSSEWTETDGWGTRWTTFFWNQLVDSTTFERTTRLVSDATYGAMHTNDPYPLDRKVTSSLPREALRATQSIQKDDAAISALARAAVAGCATELEAVARLLSVACERTVYACSADLCEPVYRVDAVYTLELGKGNCVSYANLVLALLRSAGIPAVAAHGFVVDREESHAGHAWISVYFPSWGWVEFESADWMPAYGEVPTTFLMPQHVTAYLGEGQGVSTAGFSEEHQTSFTILERPEAKASVEATCGAGETVAWALSVDGRCDEPTVVELTISGVPAGWRATLSNDSPILDPSSPRALDVLLAVTPPASSARGEAATLLVRATVNGTHVGEASFAVTVGP